VLDALRQGARPERATTMACGPLDELLALHDELGALPAVAGLHVPRQRAGLPDPLLLRTLAALPFLDSPSLSGAAGATPVVVYVAGCYAVLAVEELLAALGRPVRESLLPFGGQPEKAADIPEKPP
jgi:hypothetical protein